MPFTQAAKEIIKQSLRNAIFIDDKMVEPYQEASTNPRYLFCKRMHEDFRDNECSLDIYSYKNHDEWVSKKDFHLKRKDLLILDWTLKEQDTSCRDSLFILEQAINTESLHFVCIYTATAESDIPSQVIYRINSYFSDFDISEIKMVYSKIEEKLVKLGVDLESINNFLRLRLKELDLEKDNKEHTKTILVEVLKKLHDISPDMKSFLSDEIFKKISSKHKDTLIFLGYLLNECLISENKSKTSVRILSNNSLLIDNTIIKIFNKLQIDPSDLHEHFSTALLEGTNNFMTILALEIRTSLMESSAFIGKEIDNIDEEAFFFHESKSASKQEFFEFLKQIWKEQASSFLLKKELKILDLLDEYKKKNRIDAKIKSINWKNGEKQNNLAKLNYHYNILFSKRNKNDFIRFGDIFELYKKGYDYDFYSENIFLLNITAHCDCLRPDENIKSYFFFVQGLKDSLEKMLEKEDTEFNSYIIHNDKHIVVKWSPKPFNIFVNSNKNNIGELIPIEYFGSKKYLKYMCTIKENYAQRITNQSFAHASRVGIYFTGLKQKNN